MFTRQHTAQVSNDLSLACLPTVSMIDENRWYGLPKQFGATGYLHPRA